MNTVIMNKTNRFFNYFSKKGRVKNDLYEKLTHKGMKEVRVRNTGKDSFVMLASKTAGAGKSDMTLGVDINKGMVQKQTDKGFCLSIINQNLHYIDKFFMDLNGFTQKYVNRVTMYIGGSFNNVKTTTDVYDKYKKVSEKSAISEKISIDYNNGNFYHLEKDNLLGYKKYHKYFDGSEYINVVENK